MSVYTGVQVPRLTAFVDLCLECWWGLSSRGRAYTIHELTPVRVTPVQHPCNTRSSSIRDALDDLIECEIWCILLLYCDYVGKLL
jgi:hypothetical protein